VIWHYNRCVKIVAFAVVMHAVLEDYVSGLRSEGDSIGFAECDEYRSSCFLIVRQHAVVFVFSLESWLGHGRSKAKAKAKAKAKSKATSKAKAKAKAKAKSKARAKVKGVGQECPTHTCILVPHGRMPALQLSVTSEQSHPQPCQPRWGQRAQWISRFLLRQRRGFDLRRRTARQESRRHQVSRYFSNWARDWRRVVG